MLHRIGGPVFYIKKDGYPCWAHEHGAKEIHCTMMMLPGNTYEESLSFIEKESSNAKTHFYAGQFVCYTGSGDGVMIWGHIGERYE